MTESSSRGEVLAFVVYRPHEGQGEKTLDLVRSHEGLLRRLGLVTDRPFVHGRAEDGSLVEVFGWKDAAATAAAHEHPEVQELWGAMMEACDFPGFAGLAEATEPFANFTPW